MDRVIITSINHLKTVCNFIDNPFLITCVNGTELKKSILYDVDSKLFIIHNINDDTQQILNEKELHDYTLIPNAIKNQCMYYVP